MPLVYFLPPMSLEFGWGREVFAFAIAIQNLIWGLLQPFVGAFADRYGVKPTVCISAIVYAAGLSLMAYANTPWALVVSAGVLIGFGLSGTSFCCPAVSGRGRQSHQQNAVWQWALPAPQARLVSLLCCLAH